LIFGRVAYEASSVILYYDYIWLLYYYGCITKINKFSTCWQRNLWILIIRCFSAPEDKIFQKFISNKISHNRTICKTNAAQCVYSGHFYTKTSQTSILFSLSDRNQAVIFISKQRNDELQQISGALSPERTTINERWQLVHTGYSNYNNIDFQWAIVY